jgi:AcrR family transcriptional regulator
VKKRLEDVLACGPDFILQGSRFLLARMAEHLGIGDMGIRRLVANEDELVRQLCLRHLDEAFEAVRLPADWQDTPTEVLCAMGMALLAYAEANASRHRVFLLYRHTLDEPSRNANDTLLTYLTNNLQLALQAVLPAPPYGKLGSPARMLLGQIIHLPLWWPSEPPISKSDWLNHQIRQLAT